jgi:hypothetical protein
MEGMAESPAEVVAELQAFLNDALATAAYARMGLIHERECLTQVQPSADNPDPTIHLWAGEPDQPIAPFSRWSLSEARSQVAEDGPVEHRIGQQWIVYVFTAWEHEYRPRIAKAHGVEAGDLKVPLFGDIRLLRNDVVHHHGIATSDNSGKCELLGHWVTVDEAINVTPERLAEFWRLFSAADLQQPPN